METELIYFGFDHICRQTVARYKGQRLILQENERANKVINSLWAKSKDLPRHALDTNIRMAIREIPYTDQIWNDLLSVSQ